jgi:hypothetical protein
MEIQRGKDGMKTKMFNSTIGATAGCTLRLLLESIPDDDKGINMGYVAMHGLAVSELQVRLHAVVTRQYFKSSKTMAFFQRLSLRML